MTSEVSFPKTESSCKRAGAPSAGFLWRHSSLREKKKSDLNSKWKLNAANEPIEPSRGLCHKILRIRNYGSCSVRYRIERMNKSFFNETNAFAY